MGKCYSSGIAFSLHIDICITLEASLFEEHEQPDEDNIIRYVFFYPKSCSE